MIATIAVIAAITEQKTGQRWSAASKSVGAVIIKALSPDVILFPTSGVGSRIIYRFSHG